MSYFSDRVSYLLSQPGFRESPVTLLARSALWLTYCAVGHSPRFRLTDGVWFKVDPVLRLSGSTSAFVMRHWAEPELRYLDQLVGRDGGFMDCGANIGIYTARGAGIVGKKGKVISVEPSAVSFNRLKRNIELNGFSQVTLVNKAISDKEETARLYHADGGPVSFSLVPKSDTEFEDVQTSTIDKLVDENEVDRLDCIKLDVEGVEIPALHGAKDTLSRVRPNVIFERTSPGQKRQAATEEIPDLLLSFGYRLFRYAPGENSEVTYESPNVVAIHPDKKQLIPAVFRPWRPDGAKVDG
jgi:FkbM family methyltransferase